MINMINFLINNWYLIIIAIAGLSLLINYLFDFSQKPSAAKIQNIKEWAIYACALAEAHLGSGTGQLKMRETYDMFIVRFPDLARIVSFEMYKNIAELALLEFKQMMQNIPKVKNLILEEGGKKYGNTQNSNQ